MFRKRIKESHDTLTPSFKRLAEFILSHELDVAFMTATELAKALDVDAATVVRFSQALGYSGYRELSQEIQEVVKKDLTVAYASFPEAETDAERLRALLENERHNLEMAIAKITDQSAALLDMLSEAEQVWIVGEAAARCLARLFAAYLRAAGIKAIAMDADPAAAAHVLGDLGAGDLVVGLGITGTGLDTATVLKLAKEKGAQATAVTVSSLSPPAQVVEQVLVCPSNTPTGLPSSASVMTMLMVLWQALMARDNEQMDERISEIQHSYEALLETRDEESKRLDVKQILSEF